MNLLRSYGLHIDVFYADLNIAYLRKGQYSTRKYKTRDRFNNTDNVISGPTWPKNSSVGLNQWISKYTQLVLDYITEYGKPDIIHAHTYLGGSIAAQIKLVTSIPYSLTEHYTGWMTGDYKRSHYKLANHAFANANSVTSVSRALRNSIQALFKIDSKVLPNFIDFEVFKLSQTKKPGYNIIGIGDLIQRKQWDVLINAFAKSKDQLQDASLTIIGDGPERKNLQELINRISLSDKISLTGNLPKSKVAHEISQASLLVHTSKLESFGLTPIEALACGVPVICSDNGGSQEYSNLNGITLLENTTSASLANAVEDQYQKNPTTEHEKRTLREDAIKIYSVDSMVPQLLDMYSNISEKDIET